MRELLISLGKIIPDKLYLKILFYKHFKRNLDLNNPKTLNEKIQWLKINDKRIECTQLADKYSVRSYVEEILGTEYLIPLLGVWDTPEDIDFSSLPNQFVLKSNHDSKGVMICKDKNNFDIDAAKKFLNSRLNRNGFWYGREWPYKNIKPCIIAEQYMTDESSTELKDYKIMCFNGRPDNIMVCSNRSNGHVDFNYFDLSWNPLTFNKVDENSQSQNRIQKPKNLAKMIEIAKIFSKDFYFARIDLYNVDGQIYFGEITFYPASGFDQDLTESTDYMLGSKLKLPTD